MTVEEQCNLLDWLTARLIEQKQQTRFAFVRSILWSMVQSAESAARSLVESTARGLLNYSTRVLNGKESPS